MQNSVGTLVVECCNEWPATVSVQAKQWQVRMPNGMRWLVEVSGEYGHWQDHICIYILYWQPCMYTTHRNHSASLSLLLL